MPALSEEQVEAFENAGGLVIFNEEVGVDDPAGEPSSKGAPTASHLASIGISAAREAGLTGKGVLIGVLDTGIDAKHPEFAGKSVRFMAFKPNGERRTVGPKDSETTARTWRHSARAGMSPWLPGLTSPSRLC